MGEALQLARAAQSLILPLGQVLGQTQGWMVAPAPASRLARHAVCCRHAMQQQEFHGKLRCVSYIVGYVVRYGVQLSTTT